MGPLQRRGERGAPSELTVSDRIVRPPVDREVDDEMGFHLEMRVRELVASGMDEEEARAEALRRAGDVEAIKARMRHEARRREVGVKRRVWWDEVMTDLRFGGRQLRRAPGFAAVAVVTLGLAIGANTAVFSVVDGVLLKPLPYEDPDGVVMLWTRYLPPSGFDIAKFAISGPEILDYRESTRALSRVGIYQPSSSRTLTGHGGEAERISVTLISADVLAALGVRPMLGRAFTTEEDTPGGPAVALLSWELWRDRFGADSMVVGTSVVLNGTSTQVVGVMPEGFRLGADDQAWIPVGLDRANEGGRGGHGYYGVARMAPGMTKADVDQELELLSNRWADAYEHNVAHYIWAEGAMDAVVGDAPRTLSLLLVAVGLVLVIACANVANLLLARGERRQAEIGLRTALGASRGRIVRQMVTESLTIAAASAVLGLLLARWLTPVLIGMAPTALPRLGSVELDGGVLAFTAAVALLTALLFGVLPATVAGRRAVGRAASARPGAALSGARLRRGLVGAEVALSLVVVILAGLLVRSYAALSGADQGLETSNLLTFSLTLPSTTYPEGEEVPAHFETLLGRISALPGVSAASGASALPFDGFAGQWDFQLDDRPPRNEGDRAWNAAVGIAAPGLFETLGIPLVAGRGIGPDDDERGPWVGVVNETFARVYWPGEDPLGKRWGYAQDDSVTWISVVGVAADPVVNDPAEEPYPFVWIPAAQVGLSAYGWPRTLRMAVRTAADPEVLTPAVREVVRAFDPDLPMYGIRTMEDAVSDALARPRLATSLLSLFGVLAFVLAAVGVYGVIAYSVAARTREIGVRAALGADRGRVVRMVIVEGARPVLVGIGAGVVGAWAATGLVRSMLFGVAPLDPLTFVLVPASLLAVGVLACLAPAMRATAIAPTEALREE